jgi:hypothetical protein
MAAKKTKSIDPATNGEKSHDRYGGGVVDLPDHTFEPPPPEERHEFKAPDGEKKYRVDTTKESNADRVREIFKELQTDGVPVTNKTVLGRLEVHWPGVWKGKEASIKSAVHNERKRQGEKKPTGKKRGRKPGSKNKPKVAASTDPLHPSKPANAGDKMACIRWATGETWGDSKNWVEVADLLERAWPEINWRTKANKEQFEMYKQLNLKYQPRPKTRIVVPDTTPRPTTAPGINVAAIVSSVRELAASIGWDNLSALVTELKPTTP